MKVVKEVSKKSKKEKTLFDFVEDNDIKTIETGVSHKYKVFDSSEILNSDKEDNNIDEDFNNAFKLRSYDTSLDIKLLQLYKLFNASLNASMFGEVDVSA